MDNQFNLNNISPLFQVNVMRLFVLDTTINDLFRLKVVSKIEEETPVDEDDYDPPEPEDEDE